MARSTDWGMIGRSAVLTSLVAAVILFFAIPDQRWIAAVLVGLAIVDGVIFTLVLPRLTGGGAPRLSELDRLNAEAEAADRADDDPRQQDSGF